ncbi:hypothetical protein ACMFMG_005908 [Clarireedia jacksonii]
MGGAERTSMISNSPTSPTPRTSYGFRSPGTTSPVLPTAASGSMGIGFNATAAPTNALNLENQRSRRGSALLSGYFPDFTWEGDFTDRGRGFLEEEDEWEESNSEGEGEEEGEGEGGIWK